MRWATPSTKLSEGWGGIVGMATMHVDCDTCSARGHGCGDCVISVLLGPPPARSAPGGMPVDLVEEEQRALSVLADAGLIPPLRLTGDGQAREAV